ncbi:MAG: peptidoglycan DD-metalloendopeptidase family protein [Bacteroidales bacterium]|jgi:murein DD-endopeptidase MepM/ murein hydrolase activator NlpD|nr:peptidoglycan DD-metalloendopeptidase family protein [Bacteroidales bacterium]
MFERDYIMRILQISVVHGFSGWKWSFGTVWPVLISALLLSSCKSSRKTVSSEQSDKIEVVFDGGASKSSSPSVSSKTATVPATASSGYPAREYYGDRWNTGHVRINSDPKPSGTVTLNLAPAGTSDFVMPFCGKILSEFGPRSGRMHTGIDIKLEKDDPVYCAFDGMVRMAKDYGNYGKVVVVRHDNGLETLYSHLNSIAVKLNQRVRAGDRIGGGGKTGNAQGEHLHFETRFKGEPFNPRLAVDFEKCRLKSETLALNDNSYRQYYKNLQAAETKPASKIEQEKPSAQSLLQPGKVEHIVEKGDTLYNISRRYGTTVDSLRKLNNLTESSIIEIGQTLVVKR